jgi:hypothetical protein
VTLNTCVLQIRDLLASKTGSTDAQLVWNGSTSWDVSRGVLSYLTQTNPGSFSDAVCLQNNGTGAGSFNDATPAPTAGDGFWYLVRDDAKTWSEGYTCGIVGVRESTMPFVPSCMP